MRNRNENNAATLKQFGNSNVSSGLIPFGYIEREGNVGPTLSRGASSQTQLDLW